MSGRFHDTCWNPPWNAPEEAQEEFLGCISLRPQYIPYAPSVEEKGAGYMELPLENPSFPAGGTTRAYQGFPGLSSWKKFAAQGTVVVQRRDKPSLAVLTSPSCYQRIRGLWSPFIAAHQGLLLQGSHSLWDPSQELSQQKAGTLLFQPLESTLTKFPLAGSLHLSEGADRTGFVPSLQTPSWEIPQPNLSCCIPDLFSAGEFSRVSLLLELGGFFFAHPKN